MSKRRRACSWCLSLAIALVMFAATPALAQDAPLASVSSLPRSLFSSPGLSAPNPDPPLASVSRTSDGPGAGDQRIVAPLPLQRSRFPVLGSLYASFAALQVFDVVSTSRALAAGGREVNPMLPFANNKAALVGVKAATTAVTIYLSERVAKGNRTASVVLMAALNSAYAVIVAHNYRVARTGR